MEEEFWYQETFFCIDCIDDSYLKPQIIENAIQAECSECEKTNFVISCDDLGERIHNVLQDHYQLTPDEPEGWELYLAKENGWDRSGDEVNYVIQEIANVSPEIAGQLIDYLSEQYDPAGEDVLIEISMYGDAYYISKENVDDSEFEYKWEQLKKSIREEVRFFNNEVKDTFDFIFKNIGQLKTFTGAAVVSYFQEDALFYRARVAHSGPEELEILKSLPESLGAPPSNLAKPGRMNAAGISVFYGALTQDVCIAEVRPWVGCSVIVGQFSPLRPLRILNLSLLEKAYLSGSLFDPSHFESLSRVQFLSKLVKDIGAPIAPGSEETEYLVTQVLAEYFQFVSTDLIDGILFDSVQFRRQVDQDGEQIPDQNLVLFRRSSVLEPYNLPSNVEISVMFGFGDPEEPEPAYNIFEEIKENDKKQFDGLEELNDANPAITLNMKSVGVHQIQSVNYSSAEIPVSRHRFDPRDFIVKMEPEF